MTIARRRLAGVIGILLVYFMSVAAISPARALGSIVVDLSGTTYLGGGTQRLDIDAYVLDGFTEYNDGSPRTYQIYYANHTLVPISGSGGIFAAGSSGHYTATVDLVQFDAGNYYVSVYLEKDASNYDMKNKSFSIVHVFFFTTGPIASWDQGTDTAVIASVPFFTTQDVNTIGLDTDNIVRPANATSHKWQIFTEGDSFVAEGDLSYSTSAHQWSAGGISMAWKGSGNFYAVAIFTLTNGTTVTSPKSSLFQRVNQTEELIKYLLIIGGIGAGAIIGVVIYIKKRGSKDLARKEKKEKKEIKVLEISNEEIKKAKQGKVPESKVEVKEEPKGVTKKSGDFIFEVPKWEEGDGEK